MASPLLPFDTSQYETREVNSFIYEPVFGKDGALKDFRVVYASAAFAQTWLTICHDGDCMGANLRDSALMDEHSLQMMERFTTEPPFAFSIYLPMPNMHLGFEPIEGLPAPYAGFYVTSYIAEDSRSHFLRNIKRIGNNAILMQKHDDGHLEPIFVSDEFAEMMECTTDEAVVRISGEGFFAATHPDDQPLIRSILESRAARDGSSTLTVRKITARNNNIWCRVHYTFIDEFGGHYIYCVYNNVTALKEHEERLRSVYSSLGNTFYRMNERTLAMFRVNLTRDTFEEINGHDLYESDSSACSFTESIRKRAEHFPIQSEQTQFLEIFDRKKMCDDYMAGCTNFSQIMYSVRADGRSCFVNFTAAIARHPFSGEMIAFITEQECNAQKVSETLMGKILAQQFNMVAYIVDGKYSVTIGDAERAQRGSIFPADMNGDYQAYLDTQVRPVLQGDKAQKDETTRRLSIAAIEEGLKRGEPYVVNIAIEKGGETYYKQFDFFSVTPEARFYILLKSDNTEITKEQIALNEQLKTALVAANQANVAKTAFLSSMSHEIRTPMNAIIGLDNIALKSPDLPADTRDHLEKIGGSARHLLGLINDILDMSRIESGRMTLKNREFSFSGMLRQINTMIHSQCDDSGLEYKCTLLSPVDDFYIGDDMKLMQVIINILGNAVKFTPAPGTVSFSVERTANFEGQSTLRFVMADTGIGMDESYLPRIFDAFSQENEAAANKYGSTGLGMAITKSIVEMMNGNISVESEKGVGSTFTVNVTLKNSERTGDTTGSVKAEDLKVLVIDDDPVACEHAKIVMEEIGISVETELSGKAGIKNIRLKHARQEAYNLIFVDWKMPERDGIAVTREIRSIIGDESAVIVLTAHNWDNIEEEARSAGVDSFMAKPLFASNVVSVFEQVMASKGAAQEKKPTDLKGKRILIAEDMEINAEILKMTLDMMEIQSEVAQNGKIALEMFTAHPAHYYDAILMDMRMPVMDGLAATAEIRKCGTGDAETIPIIALTANAFDEDVQRSLQAGMNAHLSKPIEADKLFATLGSLL